MPRPPNLPSFDSIGPRVKWWREHRGIKRTAFAKMIGMSYSGLASLESGDSKNSEKAHLIAAKLRLNPHYLDTDKGEPEVGYSQEAPPESAPWPFPGIPPEDLAGLNRVERGYAESRLKEVLAEIAAERRQTKRTG